MSRLGDESGHDYDDADENLFHRDEIGSTTVTTHSVSASNPFLLLPLYLFWFDLLNAYHTTVFYREAYGIFATNGILFNHESPRRGPTFVTKKIVQGLVRIKNKKQSTLKLGNLYAIRDWGHASDYVESMWKIMQYKNADDWVIATNQDISVKKFINITAKKLKIKLKWKFKGLKEVAIDANTNKTIIKIDKQYFRPGEVDFLKGDYSKARKKLNWVPKSNINHLIDDMINSELKILE